MRSWVNYSLRKELLYLSAWCVIGPQTLPWHLTGTITSSGLVKLICRWAYEHWQHWLLHIVSITLHSSCSGLSLLSNSWWQLSLHLAITKIWKTLENIHMKTIHVLCMQTILELDRDLQHHSLPMHDAQGCLIGDLTVSVRAVEAFCQSRLDMGSRD